MIPRKIEVNTKNTPKQAVGTPPLSEAKQIWGLGGVNTEDEDVTEKEDQNEDEEENEEEKNTK